MTTYQGNVDTYVDTYNEIDRLLQRQNRSAQLRRRMIFDESAPFIDESAYQYIERSNTMSITDGTLPLVFVNGGHRGHFHVFLQEVRLPGATDILGFLLLAQRNQYVYDFGLLSMVDFNTDRLVPLPFVGHEALRHWLTTGDHTQIARDLPLPTGARVRHPYDYVMYSGQPIISVGNSFMSIELPGNRSFRRINDLGEFVQVAATVVGGHRVESGEWNRLGVGRLGVGRLGRRQDGGGVDSQMPTEFIEIHTATSPVNNRADRLDRLVERVNRAKRVIGEYTVEHGGCTGGKRDFLEATGLFEEDEIDEMLDEEVDFTASVTIESFNVEVTGRARRSEVEAGELSDYISQSDIDSEIRNFVNNVDVDWYVDSAEVS